MRPHIGRKRRNIEVADEDGAGPGDLRHDPPHLADEGKLVREFRVDLGVGLVAAGRHVEIMDGDRFSAMLDRCGDVAGVVLAAELPAVDAAERPTRDDGDAVIALLTVHCDVAVAGLAERL